MTDSIPQDQNCKVGAYHRMKNLPMLIGDSAAQRLSFAIPLYRGTAIRKLLMIKSALSKTAGKVPA
ncbi:hypothetical protein ACLQ2R_22560 [Streptosporangium sp. DT93]|uniref:hypothetical protein n=1 Tax=Streptosporangium sp. DT93 TaxID=3393428 RepID=UPI003CF21022